MPLAPGVRKVAFDDKKCEDKDSWSFIRCRTTAPVKCVKGSYFTLMTSKCSRHVVCRLARSFKHVVQTALYSKDCLTRRGSTYYMKRARR